MRWLLRLLLVLLGLALLLTIAGAAYVYVRSEWLLRTRYETPLDAVPVPRDPAGIAEGARLYRIMNCGSCHGAQGQGRVLVDTKMIGHVAAPALARVVAPMSDKDMVRALRYGVHSDGGSLYLMDVDTYALLSDADLGRIIGWIRTLRPAARDVAPAMRLGPVGRLMLATGAIEPDARSETISQPQRPPELGRYFVETSCATCHDLSETRQQSDGTEVPPLVPMVRDYEVDQLQELLHSGIAANRSRQPMMTMLAQNYYVVLRDDEIAAIYAYLQGQRRQR